MPWVVDLVYCGFSLFSPNLVFLLRFYPLIPQFVLFAIQLLIYARHEPQSIAIKSQMQPFHLFLLSLFTSTVDIWPLRMVRMAG
jgi:hypothetical protein